MSDRYECFGGPLDGQRVGDRGLLFVEPARIVPAPDPIIHARGEGVYRRTARGYEWQPSD